MKEDEIKQKLRSMQDKVEKLYEEQGLSDEVLELQIEINRLRTEFDIADEKDVINGGFVQ